MDIRRYNRPGHPLNTMEENKEGNFVYYKDCVEKVAKTIENAADAMWASMPGALTQFSFPTNYAPYNWLKSFAERIRKEG